MTGMACVCDGQTLMTLEEALPDSRHARYRCPRCHQDRVFSRFSVSLYGKQIPPPDGDTEARQA